MTRWEAAPDLIRGGGIQGAPPSAGGARQRIRRVADGNERTIGNAGFTPFIATPCFPGYPSAHASASYAARAILERVWGNGGHALELGNSALPGILLQYTNLKQITNDIDDARVYGGIHFRFDQEAGGKQGLRVGQFVFANRLLPASAP